MRKVLFVCSGNLCRSPMAEYLLQAKLGELGVNDTLVESAGTIAIQGNKAAGEAVTQLARLGIDMSAHRSAPLTREAIDSADMVIGMEQYHLRTVLGLCPSARSKTFMMGGFLDSSCEIEIPDPFGGAPDGFSHVLDMLGKAVEKIAERLAGQDNAEPPRPDSLP